MNQPTADVDSELVDLSDVTIAELPDYAEEALAPAMYRMLRRVDNPDSSASSYNPQRLD